RAPPVLGGERVDREPVEPDVQGAVDHVEQRLLPHGVPLGPFEPALLRPPAVAVHDDADVLRQELQVEVGEVAHGSATAGSGTPTSATEGPDCQARRVKLLIRRSRWYSVKP